MSIRLGTVQAIVVSSLESAALFLKTHDTFFASRPRRQASDYLTYGSKGLAFAEYGPYWRNIIKICTSQLLSSSKTESFAALRKEEIGCLVEWMKKTAWNGEVVDITGKVSEVVEDIAAMVILGRKTDDKRYGLMVILGRKTDDKRYGLKGLVDEAMSLVGAFSLADYLPFLGALDLQGLTKRLKKTGELFDQVLEKIIIEHTTDFVNVLISMMNKPLNPQDDEHVFIIDRTNIKAILIELISAAFDTSSTTIDWTISELLRHPRVMKKLQDELQSVVGMDCMVEEKDLQKLDYLDMVVKESLRLHLVAPLLIPRECMEDITIEGYYIPKNSHVMVNIWAIGHDRNVWSNNVEEFYSERFIEREIDLRGHHFELIPLQKKQTISDGG